MIAFSPQPTRVMKVYTDNRNFAARFVPGAAWHGYDRSAATPEARSITDALLGAQRLHQAETRWSQRWRYLVVSESSHRSQYDILIEQRRQGISLPDGLLCISGAGSGLHGLRRRPWAAEVGNIHLSVYLSPARPVTDSGIPFMVLAAVSTLDAIDAVAGLEGKAGVKWVNDIVLDGAKVAGVLAYTEGAGKSIDTAILGIGLNVETAPDVAGTPFVPSVSSLRDAAGGAGACTQGAVFELLIEALDRNFRLLLDGGATELIARYKARSIAIGEEVTICADDASGSPTTLAKGRLRDIGEQLELYIEGREEAVTRGRLILESGA